MKYLNNKKIQSFERDDFLKLVTGEQEKLIEVKFSEEFVDRDVQKLIEDWAALFREVRLEQFIYQRMISYNSFTWISPSTTA
jgi:transcriptional accessory protein Tex/SPT6